MAALLASLSLRIYRTVGAVGRISVNTAGGADKVGAAGQLNALITGSSAVLRG
jgi:hypothetical protein